MSVNIRNPLTGQLTNASGGVINPKSINEMIAPIEDGTASKAYAVGEQFIMNDLLCEATQAIAQGDTMVIGTNCEESEQLSKQVKDINTSLTANGNRFEASYSSANDEYGFNIGSTFYPIGASSGGGDGVVPLLDFDNAITLTSTEITTSKDGCIVGNLTLNNANNQLYINNVLYYQNATNDVSDICLPNVPKGTRLKLGSNTSSTYRIYFVPYTYATVDPTVTVYNGVDIELNYSNPLWTYDATSPSSYTATKPCYLIANLITGTSGTFPSVKVNGTTVAIAGGTQNSGSSVFLRLSRGDTVTVTNLSNNNWGNVVVLEGSVVSPEVTVFNEAEVELNYTAPLYTFDANHTSYTATKTCWLIGSIGGSANSKVAVNGTELFKAYYDPNVYLTETSVYLKLNRGDVVTVTDYNASCSRLNVLEGTVSGSVGSIGEPVFDFANPVFTFQNSAGHTTYTADHDCWLVGAFGLAALGNCDLSIDGTLIAHARYYNEACSVPIKYKILSGSTVNISNATASLYDTLHILNEV